MGRTVEDEMEIEPFAMAASEDIGLHARYWTNS